MTEKDREKFEKVKATGMMSPEQLERYRKQLEGEIEFVPDVKLINDHLAAMDLGSEYIAKNGQAMIHYDEIVDDSGETDFIHFEFEPATIIKEEEKEIFQKIIEKANNIMICPSPDGSGNIYVSAVFVGTYYNKKMIKAN